MKKVFSKKLNLIITPKSIQAKENEKYFFNIDLNLINNVSFEKRENVKGKAAFIININSKKGKLVLKSKFTNLEKEVFKLFFDSFKEILSSYDWDYSISYKDKRRFKETYSINL